MAKYVHRRNTTVLTVPDYEEDDKRIKDKAANTISRTARNAVYSLTTLKPITSRKEIDPHLQNEQSRD